jgi:hypothetical protein
MTVIVHERREYGSIADFARAHGLRPACVANRLRAGMTTEQAITGRRNTFARGELAKLTAAHGLSATTVRERMRRGQTLEQALAPRMALSAKARAKGVSPALAHYRRTTGASIEEACAMVLPRELVSAAVRARPGACSGKPCAAIRRHLAAGLTLAQALDAETAAAWQRIEARRAA